MIRSLRSDAAAGRRKSDASVSAIRARRRYMRGARWACVNVSGKSAAKKRADTPALRSRYQRGGLDFEEAVYAETRRNFRTIASEHIPIRSKLAGSGAEVVP